MTQSILLSRPDPLARLSGAQVAEVMPILLKWNRLLLTGVARNVQSRRTEMGGMPTWSNWSNNDWVKTLSVAHRTEMFQRRNEIHISLLLHLALPPGWYRGNASKLEADTQRRYGYWQNEKVWVPPKVVHGEGVWIQKPE